MLYIYIYVYAQPESWELCFLWWTEGFQSRRQHLKQPWEKCSDEARRELEYIGVLQQRAGSLNIKRLLLTKENEIDQVKEFIASLFYVWEDARLWDYWNHFVDMHLGYLGPVSCASTSWVSSGLTGSWRVAVAEDGDILCLLMWQAIFYFS